MSISASLSNSLSGLAATARSAELVSSNVANAMTEGYARREIELSSRVSAGNGGGVAVDGVSRIIDDAIVRDRRLAEASVANSSTSLAFFEDLQSLIGTPDQAGSLGALLTKLEGALIEASSRPDITARLAAVVSSAQNLTIGLNKVSDGIQNLRVNADAAIARTVSLLNEDLERIGEVNALILGNNGSGRDVSALLDQRQMLVDRIASIIPIKEFPRDEGAIALYSTTGAMLLDTRPSRFEFSASPIITADMTIQSGALSQLSLNGNEIGADGPFAPIAGGELAALFEVRDRLAPAAQTRLDAVARDLIDRVASPSVDPTLAPGSPGFFTDAGLSLDAANELGLAGRIDVNAFVDPDLGGDLWRLRDGLGAAVPGPAGNNLGLIALSDALGQPRLPSSGDGAVVARSASGLQGDLASLVGAAVRDAESNVGFETTRRDSLLALLLRQGVDTDQEMQKLLLIEQSYAANAQVIRTADEMIQLLLGL